VLDVPLHKIFQNFKIVLDNNGVAIFKRDLVDLIRQRSHVYYLIDIEGSLVLGGWLMLLRLLFLSWAKDYLGDIGVEGMNFGVEIRVMIDGLVEDELGSGVVVGLGFHVRINNFIDGQIAYINKGAERVL
jgi:hypothetical protein